MFSCWRVQRQLGAYLDGELPQNRQMAVERHLLQCRSCRTALENLRRFEQSLRAVEVPPARPDLAWRIMTEARKRQSARAEPFVIRLHHESPTSRTWAFRSAAAAVLTVGLAVGSYMGWSAERSMSPAVVAGTAEQTDSLDAYNLDYLGDAPDGSLAGSYLALASTRNGEGYQRW
jgi:anti-sigma factor RsiW